MPEHVLKMFSCYKDISRVAMGVMGWWKDPDVIVNCIFGECYHLMKKHFYKILELICKSVCGMCFGKSLPCLLGIIVTDHE